MPARLALDDPNLPTTPLDDWVVGLYASGVPVRHIAARLRRRYGVAIDPDTIAAITRAAVDDLGNWRSRWLDPVYPLVYLDGLAVKLTDERPARASTCHLLVGVSVDGAREALGLWWPTGEPDAFWPAIADDLRERGLRDVLIACADPADGFPGALTAAFPEPRVQTCLVHQLRRSMRYVGYRDRRAVARDLRSVYTAADPERALAELERFDALWGERYPMIAGAWRARWDGLAPLLSLPQELRRVVCSTVDTMHHHLRRAIKTRGHFPDERAATELLSLAIEQAETTWRPVRGWTAARRVLKVHFADRLPD